MNLSLEVAKIMWPDAPWDLTSIYNKHAAFDHTTPEALGQMAVWLARYQMVVATVGSNKTWRWHIESLLASDNPNKALAEAIVEAHNG